MAILSYNFRWSWWTPYHLPVSSFLILIAYYWAILGVKTSSPQDTQQIRGNSETHNFSKVKHSMFCCYRTTFCANGLAHVVNITNHKFWFFLVWTWFVEKFCNFKLCLHKTVNNQFDQKFRLWMFWTFTIFEIFQKVFTPIGFQRS